MTTTKTYQRASEFVKGIGGNLPIGVDMLLIKYTVGKRSMDGEERSICYITLAPVTEPENTSEYHAWSDSLVEKLDEIPDGTLPLIVKFTKVKTRKGFEVLSFE